MNKILNIGTSELLLNGIKVSGEKLTTTVIKHFEPYPSKEIKCVLLGYYSADGVIGLPEFQKYLENVDILNYQIVKVGTGEIQESGRCIVYKIKITYPDNNVSDIIVKLSVL